MKRGIAIELRKWAWSLLVTPIGLYLLFFLLFAANPSLIWKFPSLFLILFGIPWIGAAILFLLAARFKERS